MTWQEVDLLYEVQSPVHIGYLPSKESVISYTRYYIPGKNFWGAYTKVLTEKLFDNPLPIDYYNVGEWLKKNVRFTYFFISDEDSNSLLFPNFTKRRLKYGKMNVSEFQNKFVTSLVSTAIDKNSGIAKDESLHDIEFINPKYSSWGDIKNTRIFGKMFVKKEFSRDEIKEVAEHIKIDESGITVDGKDPFRVIFVGGELSNGFGKIQKVYDVSDVDLDILRFKFSPDLNGKVYIELGDRSPILGHMRYSEKYKFRGDIEMISGREYSKNEKEINVNPGKDIVKPEPHFTPGTVVYNSNKVELNYGGIWKPV